MDGVLVATEELKARAHFETVRRHGGDLDPALRDRGYRLAVVSSSLQWMMDEVLSQTRLGALFDASVSADDVAEEKPSPEPYLKALSGLGLQPTQAVVLEDSETGVASANAAGVVVVAIRHAYNGKHDMSGVIAELDGLSDLSDAVGLIDSAFR